MRFLMTLALALVLAFPVLASAKNSPNSGQSHSSNKTSPPSQKTGPASTNVGVKQSSSKQPSFIFRQNGHVQDKQIFR